MKIKSLLLILILALGMNVAGAAVTAAGFMKDAANMLTSSRSLTSGFKIESAGQQPVSGSIAVNGDRFAITTPVSSTVYDGKTQWTISTSDKEISIFEPTSDEVAQVNPFAIIRNYNRDFNIKLLSADNAAVKIQLTPKQSGSTIKSVIITFAAASKQPQKMSITLDDGTTLHVSISNLNMKADIPESRFKVSQKDYPGYDIIDLR